MYLDAEKVLLDGVIYRKVVFCTGTKYCASELLFKENMYEIVLISTTMLMICTRKSINKFGHFDTYFSHQATFKNIFVSPDPTLSEKFG